MQGQRKGLGAIVALDPLRARVRAIADRLRLAYDIGDPPTGDDDPTGELVGTILAQHTSDINSGRAYLALREAFATWDDVLAIEEGVLADVIRAGGLANIKAKRIQQCLAAIRDRYGIVDLTHLRSTEFEQARSELMALPGVGPKTAACVLLFSLGQPAIPVDTHVHRVSGRLGLIGPKVSADAAHLILAKLVEPEDAHAIHVGLVRHGRQVCKALRPLCTVCPLADVCDYYARVDLAIPVAGSRKRGNTT